MTCLVQYKYNQQSPVKCDILINQMPRQTVGVFRPVSYWLVLSETRIVRKTDASKSGNMTSVSVPKRLSRIVTKPTKWYVRPTKTPPSLIRVFAVRMKKAWVLSRPLSAKRRLWSDWADVQADLSLRWAHSHFVGFVTRRLSYCCRLTFLIHI